MSDTLNLNPDADDQKLLAQVLAYYHRTIKSETTGVEYLQQRGVTSGEAIDYFQIGLANRTLGPSLPPKALKAGKDIRQRLEQLGIYRSSGHEHFNGCVVFPIHAVDGSQRIVDVYGRKCGGHRLRKGTPLHMFLGDVRRGVFNVAALGPTDEVILCTSLFDSLVFWCHGYRNVTCTFGEDALTEDHMTALGEYHIRRVMTTHEAYAPAIMKAGMDCFALRLPQRMDVAKYAGQYKEPAHALGALIRKSEWLGKGKGGREPQRPAGASASALVLPDDEDDGDVEGDTIADDEGDGDDDEEADEPADADEDDKPVPTLHASPVPKPPQDLEPEISRDEVVMSIGHRRYRVRGMTKNLSYDVMRVNVLVSTDGGMFVDTFDLYSARHRKQFITQAAVELSLEQKTIKKDLGRVLLKLEELQDQQITALLEPKDATPAMTAEEKNEALQFLRDPKLLDRIVSDFQVVGEETNKLVGYLSVVSRKLNQPLAILVQSSTAAGKTSLMEAILSFVPPEDQIKYSAMTGQSLFYVGESDLKHKVLAIVEEEGAERASYALKLLQSEGELTIASTSKETSTGRLITQTYRVEGPVMIMLTTTAITIDEELLNRCIVLTVDEDRQQTKAIHQLQRQRQTLDGLLSIQQHQHKLALHRNAQRLLRPLLVANPYAEHLTFMDHKTRTRRDHMKYLTLIRAVTLLHQYQRPVKTVAHDGEAVEYIEVTLEDIEVANRLACEILGRTVDDLPPQTRRLLGLLEDMVNAACEKLGVDRTDYRFTRRDVRQHTGWGNTQLKVHLKRLVDLEYLLVHRGGRGQFFQYELLHGLPDDTGMKFLAGLIDVAKLRRKRSAPKTE